MRLNLNLTYLTPKTTPKSSIKIASPKKSAGGTSSDSVLKPDADLPLLKKSKSEIVTSLGKDAKTNKHVKDFVKAY